MQNQTPLYRAAEFNSKDMFEILIAKGANINIMDIISLNMIFLFIIIIF